MKEIPLTKGQVALVDDEDFDRVNKFKWQCSTDKATGRTWAHRTETVGVRKRRTVMMHRFILRVEESHIDHADSNSLNNQKYNLRLCSRVQNGRNRRLQLHSAPYKGVSFNSNARRWVAYVCLDGRKVHLGYFGTSKEAALVYDAAALKHYGEFAKTNQQLGTL